MEDVTHSPETALQQPVVMRSVLADLRSQLERSRQLTQSFDDGEARWRDGMESGLETAIEALEEALTKHFS
jgi:NADPH-dependent curcumin reductase CurA